MLIQSCYWIVNEYSHNISGGEGKGMFSVLSSPLKEDVDNLIIYIVAWKGCVWLPWGEGCSYDTPLYCHPEEEMGHLNIDIIARET